MVSRVRFPIKPTATPKRHQFQKGHPKYGEGRKRGTPNKITTLLKDAILLAAAAVGRDKKGKDGLVGYLTRAAINYPREYLVLIGKVLPLQLLGSIKVEDGKVYSVEEAEAILKERGIRIRAVFDEPLSETELPLDNLSDLGSGTIN